MPDPESVERFLASETGRALVAAVALASLPKRAQHKLARLICAARRTFDEILADDGWTAEEIERGRREARIWRAALR